MSANHELEGVSLLLFENLNESAVVMNRVDSSLELRGDSPHQIGGREIGAVGTVGAVGAIGIPDTRLSSVVRGVGAISGV